MHHPGTERHTAVVWFGWLIRHREDVRGFVSALGNPQHPIGDSRPSLMCSSGSDDQPEMASSDEIFVDLGVGRSAPDTPHRGRLTDVVDLTDESQYGTSDIGQRHQLTVDGETAGHHPVVRDELLEQFGDRRSGPGDPALRLQESALGFPWQQRLTIVELAHEIDSRFSGLERIEHLKAGARQPTWDIQPIEDMVGHEIGDTGSQVGRQPHRQSGQGVYRRAERDDTGDVLRAPVGRRLVAEHPAL